ncbi:MAG: LURP-one-related family protein [Verrucomicrobia bacterium]|nr:LURP-one-related family protein [Verrucomicrobiota bacterium]MCH8510617.1 LURP-one-related family protein [Kiritimatiellia bacterium]
MNYQIKEKLFTFGNTFDILDEGGRPAFHVKGQVFSWGKKLSFQNMSGAELAFIQQKPALFRTEYHILQNGRPMVEMMKRPTFFKPVFDMNLAGRGPVEVQGNFIAHEFKFEHRGQVLAHVSKARWSWSDSYGVSIADGEDDVLFLAACIVIDQVLHDGKD